MCFCQQFCCLAKVGRLQRDGGQIKLEKFFLKGRERTSNREVEEEKSDGSEVCVMCFILICILQVNYYIISLSLSLSLLAPSLASLSFLSLYSLLKFIVVNVVFITLIKS